jgi:hypothetical protein
MLLEQLIMAQLIVLEVFGLASDTGTRTKEKQDKNVKVDPGLFDHKLIMEQLIAGQLIEIGLMLLEHLIVEQLIVELLGLASDTGTY